MISYYPPALLYPGSMHLFIPSTNTFEHLLDIDIGPWDTTVARDKLPELMEFILHGKRLTINMKINNFRY